MRRQQICLVLGLLIPVAGSFGGQRRHPPSGTELLKSTPVSSIEPGLPNLPFDRWFAYLVRPSRPEYERNDCGERNGTPDERGKQFPACVTVTAIVGARKIDLSFVVGTYVVPENGSDMTASKPSKATFFHGSIGPGDPRMKFPTQVIRKLSEVEKLLRP